MFSVLLDKEATEGKLTVGRFDVAIVYLPRNVPHAYRITSDRADLLMITTPGGIEGMFRHHRAGGPRLPRSRSGTRPSRRLASHVIGAAFCVSSHSTSGTSSTHRRRQKS